MVSPWQYPFGSAPAGFAPGTGIATDLGEVAAEDLVAGDRVLTIDNGYQPLIWSGPLPTLQRQWPARIRIEPDSFGTGRPRRPLELGRCHRILLAGHAVALRTSEHEAIAAADHVADLISPGGSTLPPDSRLHHMLLRDHELILANGVWCESLFADANWFDSLPAAFGGMLRNQIGAPHQQAARRCLAHHETAAILSLPSNRDGFAALPHQAA